MRQTMLAACLLLFGGWLAGCGSSDSSSSSAAKPAATKPSSAKSAKITYAAPSQATPPQVAPDFALRDQNGKQVRLSDFRGRAVMMTFIYDHCPDTCPLIVGNLHAALEQLGAQARNVQMVAVSVDPVGDTPKTVKRFLAAHDMTGRMEYLIGSEKQLTPVWKRYGIQVQASPENRENVGHSALVYGITGSGWETTLYPANMKPAWVVHDVPLLAAR
jgi:protein SCO1/2